MTVLEKFRSLLKKSDYLSRDIFTDDLQETIDEIYNLLEDIILFGTNIPCDSEPNRSVSSHFRPVFTIFNCADIHNIYFSNKNTLNN